MNTNIRKIEMRWDVPGFDNDAWYAAAYDANGNLVDDSEKVGFEVDVESYGVSEQEEVISELQRYYPLAEIIVNMLVVVPAPAWRYYAVINGGRDGSKFFDSATKNVEDMAEQWCAGGEWHMRLEIYCVPATLESTDDADDWLSENDIEPYYSTEVQVGADNDE